MSNDWDLTPEETTKLFSKDEEKKVWTLEELSNYLDIEVETLLNMTLEEIEQTSTEMAERESVRMNNLLEKRDIAFDQVTQAQSEYGITKDDLTTMYFENLKAGPEGE